MRFAGDGDEYFQNSWYFWDHNVMRALGGKKGQAALRDLEQALLALPEKKLIPSQLSDGKNVCTVGALVAHRQQQEGFSRDDVLRDLHDKIQDPDWDSYEAEEQTTAAGVEAGLSFTLAVKLGQVNDDLWAHPDETPEERYDRVLAWTKKMIQEEVAA